LSIDDRHFSSELAQAQSGPAAAKIPSRNAVLNNIGEVLEGTLSSAKVENLRFVSLASILAAGILAPSILVAGILVAGILAAGILAAGRNLSRWLVPESHLNL
jgi:hypothetical protein